MQQHPPCCIPASSARKLSDIAGNRKGHHAEFAHRRILADERSGSVITELFAATAKVLALLPPAAWVQGTLFPVKAVAAEGRVLVTLPAPDAIGHRQRPWR
jgi:hypothetical protein